MNPQAAADMWGRFFEMKAGFQTEDQKRAQQRAALRRDAELRLMRRLSLKAQMRLTACAVRGNA
ncbi:hypothetical protein [Sagittula sp. P11]|uniref:hypothetical protein n=1 Tax=Sagittula sp. P11 TaxID=2009329 RepID=UPI0012FE0E28|nr:hypothetical protein [Sagittula sp. P11]